MRCLSQKTGIFQNIFRHDPKKGHRTHNTLFVYESHQESTKTPLLMCRLNTI